MLQKKPNHPLTKLGTEQLILDEKSFAATILEEGTCSICTMILKDPK